MISPIPSPKRQLPSPGVGQYNPNESAIKARAPIAIISRSPYSRPTLKHDNSTSKVGPSTYLVNDALTKFFSGNIKISPKKRFDSIKITPGPGEYNTVDLKNRASSALITKTKRFKEKEKSPAPGQYRINTD